MLITKEDLMNFEQSIEDEFLAGKIKAPIHLSRGNESALVDLFKNIKPMSWVFSTHRSHLHALLHGIPADWLKKEILAGRSMHINSRKYKFMTSSIVNGCTPIALGVAMALKRKGSKDKVWCFVGDMASSVGGFYECTKYARNFDLPIYFVVECNNLSTNTPTDAAWGYKHEHHNGIDFDGWHNGGIYHYCYIRGCPHINCDKWIIFK